VLNVKALTVTKSSTINWANKKATRRRFVKSALHERPNIPKWYKVDPQSANATSEKPTYQYLYHPTATDNCQFADHPPKTHRDVFGRPTLGAAKY
jgi:hypothetical protein